MPGNCCDVGCNVSGIVRLDATLPGFGQFILYASTDDCLLQADNVLNVSVAPLAQLSSFPLFC